MIAPIEEYRTYEIRHKRRMVERVKIAEARVAIAEARVAILKASGEPICEFCIHASRHWQSIAASMAEAGL